MLEGKNGNLEGTPFPQAEASKGAGPEAAGVPSRDASGAAEE